MSDLDTRPLAECVRRYFPQPIVDAYNDAIQGLNGNKLHHATETVFSTLSALLLADYFGRADDFDFEDSKVLRILDEPKTRGRLSLGKWVELLRALGQSFSPQSNNCGSEFARWFQERGNQKILNQLVELRNKSEKESHPAREKRQVEKAFSECLAQLLNSLTDLMKAYRVVGFQTKEVVTFGDPQISGQVIDYSGGAPIPSKGHWEAKRVPRGDDSLYLLSRDGRTAYPLFPFVHRYDDAICYFKHLDGNGKPQLGTFQGAITYTAELPLPKGIKEAVLHEHWASFAERELAPIELNQLSGEDLAVQESLASKQSPFERHGLENLGGEITSGGFGIIYFVKDRRGKEYALKVLKPDRIKQQDQGFEERFRREAEIMKSLDPSKHVLKAEAIYENWDTEGVPAILMKRCEYSLADRLAGMVSPVNGECMGLDLEEVKSLAGKMLEALAYLHHKGDQSFIHRDLKPANILYLNDEPFLADFGICKEVGLNFTELSNSANAAASGTARWQEKEIQERIDNGGRAPDQKADLFSLGMVLQYAAGKAMGKNPSDSHDSLVTDHRIVPGRLGALITLLLIKDHSARPSAAEALDLWRGADNESVLSAASLTSSLHTCSETLLGKEKRRLFQQLVSRGSADDQEVSDWWGRAVLRRTLVPELYQTFIHSNDQQPKHMVISSDALSGRTTALVDLADRGQARGHATWIHHCRNASDSLAIKTDLIKFFQDSFPNHHHVFLSKTNDLGCVLDVIHSAVMAKDFRFLLLLEDFHLLTDSESSRTRSNTISFLKDLTERYPWIRIAFGVSTARSGAGGGMDVVNALSESALQVEERALPLLSEEEAISLYSKQWTYRKEHDLNCPLDTPEMVSKRLRTKGEHGVLALLKWPGWTHFLMESFAGADLPGSVGSQAFTEVIDSFLERTLPSQMKGVIKRDAYRRLLGELAYEIAQLDSLKDLDYLANTIANRRRHGSGVPKEVADEFASIKVQLAELLKADTLLREEKYNRQLRFVYPVLQGYLAAEYLWSTWKAYTDDQKGDWCRARELAECATIAVKKPVMKSTIEFVLMRALLDHRDGVFTYCLDGWDEGFGDDLGVKFESFFDQGFGKECRAVLIQAAAELLHDVIMADDIGQFEKIADATAEDPSETDVEMFDRLLERLFDSIAPGASEPTLIDMETLPQAADEAEAFGTDLAQTLDEALRKVAEVTLKEMRQLTDTRADQYTKLRNEVLSQHNSMMTYFDSRVQKLEEHAGRLESHGNSAMAKRYNEMAAGMRLRKSSYHSSPWDA